MGMVTFAGMRDGFYDFSVSKTGWEPLVYAPPNDGSMVVSNGKVRLLQSYFGSVYLRPVKQSLVVNVRGYDPVLDQPDQPLKGISLTLTGVDPITGAILLPPKTVVSGEDGSYEFTLLPPVNYRITASQSGYQSTSVLAVPKGDATFDPETLNLILEPTQVRAILSSVYQSAAPYTNAMVRLQGIRGSATEGIDRIQVTTDDLTNHTASALFENLLPGRYWLYVNHESTIMDLETQQAPLAPFFAPLNSSPSSFHVKFRPREAYAEVGVATQEPVEIVLDPQPAVVRGKLHVTDEIGNLDRDPFFSEPNRIFRSIQQDGIEFWESKLVGLLTNQAAVVSVNTDAAGGFTALVIPGVFGVKIPTMTNYSGHNIEFGDLTEGEGPHHQEWPYSDLWPHTGFDFGHHGPGLRFDSGHEYQLDLFAHAHYINILGGINPKDEPFSRLVLRMDEDGANEVSVPYHHLSESGAIAVATGPVTRTGVVREDSYYLIRDVLPGTYSITIQHPDYTTPPVQVTITPWEPPGFVPAVDPAGPTWFFPGITHDLQLQGVLEPAWSTTGSILIEKYTFDAGGDPPGYRSNGASRPGYFSMASLPGKLFTYNGGGAGIPSGNYNVWLRHGDGWYTAQGTGSQTFDGAVEGGGADNTPPNAVPTDERTYTLILKTVSDADPLMVVPNITVSFASGDSHVANQTVAHNGSFVVIGTTDPTGRWSRSFFSQTQMEILDVSNRVVQVTLPMSRNMTIQGKVEENGEPIPDASVVIRNKYSGPLAQAVTDADGSFSFGFLQPQEFLVEVNRRGFISQRKRLIPEVANPDVTVDFDLAPVPAPSIDTFTMNRFGLFVPGVSKAGDATGFDANDARPKLTATWKATTTPTNFTEILDGFVQEDDTPGPQQVRQIQDPIVEMWLMDRRAFTNSFVNDPNQIPHLQVDPASHNLSFITMKRFLDELVSGKRTGQNYIVYHQQVMTSTNQVAHQHQRQIPLWELPSGGFSPRLVAITQHGGVAIRDYEVPEGKPPLQGLNLPTWASSFVQVIGNIAALGGGGVEDEQEFPKNLIHKTSL